MKRTRLRISSSAKVPKLKINDFLWRPLPLESSFHTSVGPRLETLGVVSPLCRDFAAVAALVYLADKTTPRAAAGREREIDLQVAVSDPDRWGEFSGALADLLRFLTGDVWDLRFSGYRSPKQVQSAEPAYRSTTSLFSGGADSLSGAVILGNDGAVTLVSHWSDTGISGFQTRLVQELESMWSSKPEHLRVRLGKRSRQIGTGDEFGVEVSSRSRSLLFIALGVAAASVRGGSLAIPENGFASLNVPLSSERRGALSTRTTHPAFLDGLGGLLDELGVSVPIGNPFSGSTKGELFGQVKDVLGPAKAGQLLSHSHSCAKSNMWRFGLSPVAHCGVCFGCLVRQAAFKAAKIPDATEYANEVLVGDRRKRFFKGTRLAVYESVRYAVDRGVSEADILAIGLPSRVTVAEATALVNAGLKELGELNIRTS